jgi:hypothetical protein
VKRWPRLHLRAAGHCNFAASRRVGKGWDEMDLFDELHSKITALAAANGDGAEVQNRRGLGTIGISLFSLSPGMPHSVKSEWLDEIDGMTIEEAHRALAPVACTRCKWHGHAIQLLDMECCPTCRLII